MQTAFLVPLLIGAPVPLIDPPEPVHCYVRGTKLHPCGTTAGATSDVPCECMNPAWCESEIFGDPMYYVTVLTVTSAGWASPTFFPSTQVHCVWRWGKCPGLEEEPCGHEQAIELYACNDTSIPTVPQDCGQVP